MITMKSLEHLHRKGRFSSTCSIAALGLLLGILTGLSTSPVVGSLVGTLATVLVVSVNYLLKTHHDRRESAPPVDPRNQDLFPLQGYWLAVFCLSCIVGVFSGIWIRTHDLLSPSIRTKVHWWTEAGYPEDEARKIVARFLLTTDEESNSNDGTDIGGSPKNQVLLAANNGISSHDSVLFASQGDWDIDQLCPDQYLTSNDVAAIWMSRGDKTFPGDVAHGIAQLTLSDEQKKEVFKIVWNSMKSLKKIDQ